MKLAGTVILVERELQSAVQSIKNIFEGVDLRVKQLSVTFRQQGADPKARFTLYAHGLYNIWYNPDLIPGDAERYWASNDIGPDDTELEIDTNALKFGPFSLPEAGGQLEGPVQLAPLRSSSEEPQGVKEEYMRLSERAPRPTLVLPPEDVQWWSSLAELHLRKRLIRCYCDACHSHIIDVHHRCIDCKNETYDLCVDCEPLPASKHKHQSNHKLTHNMLVVRISRPVVSYQRAMWITKKFLSALLPVADPPEGSPTECGDESTTQSITLPDTGTSGANSSAYTCSECGVGPVGIFYVCVVCAVNENPIVMCRECAFRDAFNVVKKHDYTHYLVKIKDRVQDAHATSEELADAKKMDEASTFEALSLRVDKLAAMVESRFAELDRRLGELMEKVHLSSRPT
ncbi:hypothetical protein M405DRAFT_877998 [Rhizopogon salebrosus TDB-379]|nr:hypothetical protein M405DRAFT_877998 [Rhizopogon salebrosus TDB-379]